MEILAPELELAGFFRSLRRAPQNALLLDYDGTLAPFCPVREQAHPYPGVRELLERLVEVPRNRVVIVTGRAVADLKPLLALKDSPEIWGSHGWEREMPGGAYTLFPPGEAVLAGLQQAAALAAQRWPEAVESKPAAVAFHVRNMEPVVAAQALAAVGATWEPIAREAGLAAIPFDGGIELRATARDKGTAVRTVRGELGEGAVIAYLGDDRTDEDAFAAVGPGGLAVLVRPEKRPTAAALWLRPPEDLLEFFRRWEHAW